jgi:release factor glutamine methyltransferase
MSSVQAQVAEARSRLVAAGIPSAEADRDARLLARWQLGWDASRFWTGAAQEAPDDFASGYDALIARRLAREPIAYITGTQEFWGLAFEVSPAVLIPRPETELIVEVALELCPGRDVTIDIGDVCTGSGCLAVALAHELPNARIVATDLSTEALEIARRNAGRHGASRRVELIPTDLLADVNRTFHLIVSNPPYVPARDRETLQPEVRDHEPPMALFAGDAGLSVIPRLLDQSAAHLHPGGVLIFEFGFGQVEAVLELIAQRPSVKSLDVRTDLQGIPRVVVAQRT